VREALITNTIQVCNAPSYFSRMWSLLKKFVNPVTANKIAVLKSADVYGTLNQYISHDNIPTQFGGGFRFSNGMLPDLCPAIQQAMHWSNPSSKTLPPGPIKWKENGHGRIVIATGTANGVRRATELASLVEIKAKKSDVLLN
jgi:hypothetical protein